MLVLSLSAINLTNTLEQEWQELFEQCQQSGTALAIGGRALTEDLRDRLPHTTYCKNMETLIAFAKIL